MQKAKWKDMKTSVKVAWALLNLQAMNFLTIGLFFADNGTIWVTLGVVLSMVAMFTAVIDLNRAFGEKNQHG